MLKMIFELLPLMMKKKYKNLIHITTFLQCILNNLGNTANEKKKHTPAIFKS